MKYTVVFLILLMPYQVLSQAAVPPIDSSANHPRLQINDSEPIHSHLYNQERILRLQRSARRFAIIGAVLVTVGVPLTILASISYCNSECQEKRAENDDDHPGMFPHEGLIALGITPIVGGIALLILAAATRSRYKRLMAKTKMSFAFAPFFGTESKTHSIGLQLTF